MKQQLKTLKYIYYHAAQILTNLICAAISLNIWGRGTGKTYGVTSPKSYYFAITMPRSVGAIGCPSYQHMMEHIFPQVVKGWETMGLVEGKDFVCFEKPPAHFDRPHIRQKDYKRCIHFRNGSVVKLFSFNYNSLSNGDSIDWMIIDEARLCKEEKVSAAIKCLRGNEEHFGHLSQHKSITFVTDMPSTPSEFWLFKFFAQEKTDTKAKVEELAEIKGYLDTQIATTKNKAEKKIYIDQSLLINEELNTLCTELTYVSLADSLENIYALGYNTIKQWLRSDEKPIFDTSVLNKIPKMVANCFYPDLDKDKHGYITPESDYSDVIDYREERDCRWDGDIDEDQPLFIGMDYNSDISCISVGQLKGNQITLLKVFWVLAPLKRADVLRDFMNYYSFLKHMEIIYFYDNTAVATDADKNEEETYAANTVNELEEEGFKVTPIYLVQTDHEFRYNMIAAVLTGGTLQYPFTFAYNMENAGQFEYCATRVQTQLINKNGRMKFEKDKRQEKARKVRPENSVHITEAFDTMFNGMIKYAESTVSA
ncbi:hypothetical protein VB796_08700 [Arcicella sp. LKC2W]|uniref:hypothetical protein n=1 Tax=Arcicella sp. LKC2W TaxID=2984198 RepID=UPI002B1FE01E|nr:hypothetical protein [Arcicella sp. LKC2W]MEA5459113.1 hypothetical protein [Arcicella sp. LKC2W]